MKERGGNRKSEKSTTIQLVDSMEENEIEILDSRIKSHVSVDIVVNHGGRFETKPCKYYKGGEIYTKKGVDISTFKYQDILNMVEDLGYNNVAKIYYYLPWISMDNGGLKLLWSDESMQIAIENSMIGGLLELYLEHDEGDFFGDGVYMVAEELTHNVVQLPNQDDNLFGPDDGYLPQPAENNEPMFPNLNVSQYGLNEEDFEVIPLAGIGNENTDSGNIGATTVNNDDLFDVNVSLQEDGSMKGGQKEDGYESEESEKGSLDGVDDVTDDEELQDVRAKAKEFRKRRDKMLLEDYLQSIRNGDVFTEVPLQSGDVNNAQDEPIPANVGE